MNIENSSFSENKKLKRCITCSKENSNYKCPKCKAFYCSIVCCKSHKELSCSTNISDQERILTQLENNERENKPLYLDENEDIILDDSELSKLKENKKVMTMIKNKKLQKIIRHIDSTKYKKTALEKMLSDQDFKNFTDEILITLGYLYEGVFTY